MGNYLVVKDNKLINIIVAESKEIAEEVTQLSCYLQDDYITTTVEGGVWYPKIGCSFDGSKFIGEL